jgi:aerobic carbon-monoxide dehydrogenase medium subunit
MRFRGRRDVIRLDARSIATRGVSMAAATVALGTGPEVLQPASEQEAIEAFGDGAGVTILAGGTIVVPEMTYGYLKPERVLMLGRAGLAGISTEGVRTTIGAMTPVADLASLPAPLGPCAANVADPEIRAQGTIGGNLCAPAGRDAPRGDLQAALLALDAQVRSSGAGGERTEAVESFLTNGGGRLVLDISFDEPAAGAFARLDRPHTHDYSALTVCVARGADGTVRIAAAGVDGPATRLPSAEAKAGDPAAAGEATASDATFADDALASAWYRERTLPVLVRRALTELQEDA